VVEETTVVNLIRIIDPETPKMMQTGIHWMVPRVCVGCI